MGIASGNYDPTTSLEVFNLSKAHAILQILQLQRSSSWQNSSPSNPSDLLSKAKQCLERIQDPSQRKYVQSHIFMYEGRYEDSLCLLQQFEEATGKSGEGVGSLLIIWMTR